MNLFYELNRNIHPDHISQQEAIYIRKASIGALIYAEYYEGKAYKYDMTSFYLSIMAHNNSLYPMKEGKAMKLTQEEFNNMKFFYFGFYFCEIEKNDDAKKFFRWNKKNVYTHYDLFIAKSEGLKITLLDLEVNFYHYERKNCMTGKELFGEYANIMYGLKKMNIKTAKLFCSGLWGMLSEKDEIALTMKIDEDFEVREGKRIEAIRNTRNVNIFEVVLVDQTNEYKTDFARISPFILSKGRYEMYKIIKPIAKHVVRIHTDGFITDKKLKNINDQGQLGDLKYEGYCENCEVVNAMKVIGEFIL